MNGHLVNRGTAYITGDNGKRKRVNVWGIVLESKDASGKRRQKWITYKGSKSDAKAKLQELLTGKRSGDYVEPSKMTVSQFLPRWLEHKRSRVADKTLARWEEIATKHIDPVLGHIRLQALDWQHIDDYYREARESGRLDGKGGLAERTLLHHHRMLDNAMKWAVKKGLRRTNPCESADTPSPRGRKARSLDPEEVQALIDNARDTRLYAPLVVDYTTGLRRGELLGLRLSLIHI